MATDYWQPLIQGNIYHIYNKAGTGLTIFKDDDDYINFLDKWNKYFGHYMLTFAYCLVPNHFHFLVSIKEPDDKIRSHLEKENSMAANKFMKDEIPFSDFLSDQFRRLGSSIALNHKYRYHRTGALFMNKVKRISITSQAHLIYIFCYIHHNVIHHQLGSSYDDWKFTSYHAYLSQGVTRLAKEIMMDFVGTTKIFHQVHREFQLYMKDHKDIGIDNAYNDFQH